MTNLIDKAEKLLSKALKRGEAIVGHQFSSDIGVVLNFSERNGYRPKNFRHFKTLWHERDQGSQKLNVFDTRYDLDSFLENESRRLVDICEECGLDVSQPELRSESMTKFQKKYFETHDKEIMERLSVLNIRHSLSAAIVYLLYKKSRKPVEINVNNILEHNLRDSFDYIDTSEFNELLPD